MISLIAAVARNRVIGAGNRLIWHISEDLRHFKTITSGHPVIMGRKTFESLGRPLPNRPNVVISRQTDYRAEGCIVVDSLVNALLLFPAAEEVFIIGGAQIYAQALPFADRFYLTEVGADYSGDTYFPEWDRSEWRLTEQDSFPRGEKFPHPFAFLRYDRIR